MHAGRRRAARRDPTGWSTTVLFQSVDPAGRRLTGRALQRRVVLAMIKRRARPPSTCCTRSGRTLEHAQQSAGHV